MATAAQDSSPTLLMLMKQMEAEFFKDFAGRLAPTVRTVHVDTLEALEQAVPGPRPHTRLFAFSTSIIVPPPILKHLNYNAVNFHPGPPEYPGYRPTGFALYDRARSYGVTAHYMTDRVDEGPIIGVDRFPVAENAFLIDVVKESYQRLAKLALAKLPALLRVDEVIPPSGERWTPRKTTKAQYDAMRRIPRDMPDAEIAERFRCFDGIYTPLDPDFTPEN
ncbi:formyltransferase family protein [Hwanghaeella sp.]|uniref:formyltransferase family protein n=1 Tax=Hwanghaeella sp. TaxID=2605943 RepID=UPI003CCC23EB